MLKNAWTGGRLQQNNFNEVNGEALPVLQELAGSQRPDSQRVAIRLGQGPPDFQGTLEVGRGESRRGDRVSGGRSERNGSAAERLRYGMGQPGSAAPDK